MSPLRALAMVGLCALGACAYHNVIYNSERLFTEGEAYRAVGQDSLAQLRYLDVIRKTGDALRSRPESSWAPEALYLLGRTRLRLGELREARAALEEVAARQDGDVRASARVYLAVVRAELGDRQGALDGINQALGGPLADGPRAEAHLLRGRLLAEAGHLDQAWWDLDRASELDENVRAGAGLERLRWSIAHGERERARAAVDGLFALSGAGARVDTVRSLIGVAADRWGPETAADLLSQADRAKWDRVSRGGIALERARWLDEAGDTVAAADQAFRVAGGLGVSAARARLQLARWRAERARDLPAIASVRGLLLPSGSDPEVAVALIAVDDVERYASIGLDEPLGWFAAAEIARDRLGAKYVARGLFLAYADGAPEEPWAPKALLAALDVSPDEGDRAWLRGRLEAHRSSPYVLAAQGGAAAGFQDLEEELDVRLRALAQR